MVEKVNAEPQIDNFDHEKLENTPNFEQNKANRFVIKKIKNFRNSKLTTNRTVLSRKTLKTYSENDTTELEETSFDLS